MRAREVRASTVDGEPARAEALLVVTGLDVVYSRHIPALTDVTIEVNEGEIVALLGSNGAGKTTLIRAITGLLRFHDGVITRGRIGFRGYDVTRTPPESIVEAGAAQVMEGGRVFAEMTVADNLAAGAIVNRDRRAMPNRRREIYDLFPVLRDRRDHQAGYLSGGERQMLAIGRALMSRPSLLLLDEPSLGLAPLVADQIREIVLEISKRGATVLLVEQNAAMALSISDRAYVLQTGTVAMTGRSDDLLSDSRVQALYLGTNPDGSRSSYREARARGPQP